MTQNIYDDVGFFQNYSQLPRSLRGLDGAPEWPALRALLPPLAGAIVLDLGCGFGWFCRFAAGEGAAEVVGVDVSERMLARARAETSSASVRYEQADLETYAPAAVRFDLIYSSLAFHYLAELPAVFGRIQRALKPGGRFVFSVEHPIMTAPRHQGWSQDESGLPVWPVGAYLDEGRRITDWLADGVVKQHRTLATYLNLLIGLGLRLRHVEEWGPTPEQIAAEPDWARERERPAFLLIAAERP
ncbi:MULTISPECIES: class I SAM-dependent methyltransferase [unclassified Bosea (in: a-proteobacteria)]|uniref:class I SAM-dependent methyltransferase n=1 Tax=unclassified Bosea (in: a-proteobacteria) TaxID=2653178 RepID=UPI000F7565D0|nr:MULTISPECIES: class I SAM-dependent methyltransferase [unclassified Bosea (in: a-proteobacteria)]AZO76796.1 SAM-dependent methyltransferase [Bosea sp. Tri-49]RXT21630.1 SAM-dependent methyltransferase [Bosea sp. Tri-39]RXT31969.1 SAM-dependent methyltransferase [Bosea sp. Tri-54]